MQPLGLSTAHRTAYYDRLFGSHDFRIDVDVLTMDEHVTGSARFLDGQVNITADADVPRTCSLTLSDPHGALDFSGAAVWSGSSVWLDRLIRVRHSVKVDGLGWVTVTPFIGPPSAMTRTGAEVAVECQDKTSLALRGCPPFSVAKGANAVDAIRRILSHCTGEFRFRLPAHSRRLSKPYSVGWDDATSPWKVAQRIASRELGLQLIYSCDGYATLRKKPTSAALTVRSVTEAASVSVDFTTISNWVQVLGQLTTTSKSSTKNNVTTTVKKTKQPRGVAVLKAAAALSPQKLARKGVYRYLPLLIEDSSYTKTSQVKARAVSELTSASRLEHAPQFSCIPFFHADVDDVFHVATPAGTETVRLTEASIPLGVGGEMTIGSHRWVSRPPLRSRAHMDRTKKVTRKRHHKHHPKGGKK